MVSGSRSLGIAVVGSFLVLLSVGAGRAQPNVGERIGDWTLQCKALLKKQTVCALTQTIVNPRTKQRVLRLTLRKLEESGKLALIVVAPLGIHLATGMAGKLDEGKQFAFIWQRCTNQGCSAAVEVDEKMKWTMMAGKQLFIAFKPQADIDALKFAVSLMGVTKGLEALDDR